MNISHLGLENVDLQKPGVMELLVYTQTMQLQRQFVEAAERQQNLDEKLDILLNKVAELTDRLELMEQQLPPTSPLPSQNNSTVPTSESPTRLPNNNDLLEFPPETTTKFNTTAQEVLNALKRTVPNIKAEQSPLKTKNVAAPPPPKRSRADKSKLPAKGRTTLAEQLRWVETAPRTDDDIDRNIEEVTSLFRDDPEHIPACSNPPMTFAKMIAQGLFTEYEALSQTCKSWDPIRTNKMFEAVKRRYPSADQGAMKQAMDSWLNRYKKFKKAANRQVDSDTPASSPPLDWTREDNINPWPESLVESTASQVRRDTVYTAGDTTYAAGDTVYPEREVVYPEAEEASSGTSDDHYEHNNNQYHVSDTVYESGYLTYATNETS